MVALSSLVMIFGECSTIHSSPAFFFFFFKVEISSRTLIALFMPGSVHSGSTCCYNVSDRGLSLTFGEKGRLHGGSILDYVVGYHEHANLAFKIN